MKSKRNQVIKHFLIMIGVVLIATLISVPILQDMKFGLDLAGGFEVLYQVHSIDGEEVTTDMVTSTYKTMLRRIDSLGVSEPNIIVEGDRNIRVQLAGITDVEEAREMLSQAANLTFRDTNDNLLATSEVLKSGGAKVSTDSSGNPAVSLSVSDQEAFYKMTKKVSEMDDNRIVIWLDFNEEEDSFASEEAYCGSLSSSKCLSAATVSQGFSSDVIIQGSFTSDEVSNLVELINSGSLPTKLEEISSRNVSASFGENSLSKTFTAGVVGIALIMVLMVVLYKYAGFVASMATVIYTAVTLFTFWLLGGVLTLPGIAGLVVGIGMAVDAIVLTFARIKDEMKEGKMLKRAYEAGNKSSFTTILDANVTTLIAAVILFFFGESTIKGFATILIISTIVTMFVMVYVSRWMLSKFVHSEYFDDKEYFFLGIKSEKLQKKTRIDKLEFVKNRRVFYGITICVSIIGVVSLFVSGLNLGIDFKGGSSLYLSSDQTLTQTMLKEDIIALGYEFESIEFLNDGTISVRIADTLDKEQIEEAQVYFDEAYEATTDIGVVSNVVKQELIKNAIKSLLFSAIGIIIYVSFRFQFRYAIAGLIALATDVFVIVAFFSIFGLEVSSIFIAAVLSIIGYSINDTIVTFDRIKETIAKRYKKGITKKEQLQDAVNDSLRATLSRSLITTFTTIIPIVSLIILGSHEILNFNIALLLGMIAGVYSSVCIASQLWYDMERRKLKLK